MPGCYNFYEDPLHNLIIEYPKKESLYIRERDFRKKLYSIYA